MTRIAAALLAALLAALTLPAAPAAAHPIPAKLTPCTTVDRTQYEGVWTDTQATAEDDYLIVVSLTDTPDQHLAAYETRNGNLEAAGNGRTWGVDRDGHLAALIVQNPQGMIHEFDVNYVICRLVNGRATPLEISLYSFTTSINYELRRP